MSSNDDSKYPPPEDEATNARRKAIREIMTDSSIPQAEKSKRIQALMSGKAATTTTNSAAVSDGDSTARSTGSSKESLREQAAVSSSAVDDNVPSARSAQSDVGETGSAKKEEEAVQTMEEDEDPAVVRRRAIQEIMRDPNIPQAEKSKRIQEFMARKKTDPLAAMKANKSDGIGGKDKDANKRSGASATKGRAIPGSVGASALSSADDRIARKIAGENSKKSRSGKRSSMPGAATAVSGADDRIAKKISQSSKASRPGATSANDLDDRIARKQHGQTNSTSRTSAVGAYQSTNDDKVKRKQSGAKSNSRMSKTTRGAPAPGVGATAVTDLDDRIAAKQRSSGGDGMNRSKVGAVSAKNDDKVSRKISANKSNVGARRASDLDERIKQKQNSNPAKSRGSSRPSSESRPEGWVQDELFQDEEGSNVDPDDYIMDIKGELDSRGGGKNKQRKEVNFSTLTSQQQVKDGVEPDLVQEEVAPGAFSVQAPVWRWLGRNQEVGDDGEVIISKRKRKKSKSKKKNRASARVIDTGIDGDDMYDYVEEDDEEGSCWSNLDKTSVFVGIFILVGVSIAVSLPVYFIKKGNAPTPAPTFEPRDHLLPEFQRYFADQIYSGNMAAFENRDSPEHQALQYIVIDDPLRLAIDDPTLIQRYVLMVMYHSNNGSKWPVNDVKWGSPVHECDWDYIDCKPCTIETFQLGSSEIEKDLAADELCVSKMELFRVDMAGTLISEIGQLSQLEILDVAQNRLQGSIPLELYKLTNLHTLQLEKNQLSGPIHDEIGAMIQLHDLSIYNNQFTGFLPMSMANLINMERFFVINNQDLKGKPFDDFVLNWKKIVGLQLSGCSFDGSIPTTVGLLTDLEVLGLRDLNLEGTIPSEIGKLTNLEHLVISRNKNIQGSIPSAISNCHNMIELRIDSLSLSDSIPSELGKLTKVETINVGQNKLTGKIPSELGRCTSLKELSVFLNQLTGEVPPELGSLTVLERLFIQRNSLTGVVPDEVCSLRDESLEDFVSSCERYQHFCPKPECCTQCTL